MNEVESQQKNTEFVDIRNMFNVLKKRKNIIFITTIALTVLMFLISMFVISPKYSSSTDILVNRKNQDNQINAQAQIQADVQMINTYKDIITSPTILDDVSDNLHEQGYKMTADDIKKSIDISSQQNSQVFTINVKTKNPKLSAAIANTIADVFKTKVKKIMSVNNVSILSRAQIEDKPVSPKIMVNTMIGLLGGLIWGIILAFAINGLDRTVNDMSFVTEELGLNDLGIINEIPASKVKKMISSNGFMLSSRKSSNKKNRRV